jgi:hypothetical protein
VLAGLQFTEENTLWSSDDRHAAENDIDQVAFFSLLGRWKPEKRKHEIDGGLKFALYAQPGSPGIDGLGLVNYYGGYFKGLYGGDRFKAGVQLDFGRAKGNNYGTFREFIIIGSPVVRFNFGRRY